MSWTRRRILQAIAGIPVVLPVLESVAAELSAQRLAWLYIPNGVPPQIWQRGPEGSLSMSGALSGLQAHAPKVRMLSGLRNTDWFEWTSDAHAGAGGTVLTGDQNAVRAAVGPTKGFSVDQLAADVLGTSTPIQSLVTGSEGTGPCPGGEDCAGMYGISWRGPVAPVTREESPRRLYERLFGPVDADPALTASRDLAALDAARVATDRLQARVSMGDRQVLEQYLESLYEVEREIDALQTASVCTERPELVPVGRVAGAVTTEKHAGLMLDLLALALQCDLTRVCTWMAGNESSHRVFPFLGDDIGHHPSSHHQNYPEVVALYETITTWQIDQAVAFIDRLSELQTPQGSLLDCTAVVMLAAMADGNEHVQTDLPVAITGSLPGMRTGVHTRHEGVALSSLHASILDAVGASVPAFGVEASGPLDLS